LAALPRFLDTMHVFAAASNQHLQRSKVKALLLGAAANPSPGSAPAPTSAHGITVVTSAVVLGVTVGAVDSSALASDWEAVFARVWSAFGRIALANLSTFGRGFASAAYGIATLLHRAELSDPLSPSQLDTLTSHTAKLVDRGLAPTDTSRRFAGIKQPLLPGAPSTGGFGPLPFREHLIARHAGWTSRLSVADLSRDSAQSWAVILGSLLRDCYPSPHCHSLWLFTHPKLRSGRRAAPLCSPLPSPLSRLLLAARALPPLVDVGSSALVPGPWCSSAAIWGNPLIAQEGVGLEHAFSDLVEIRELATLGDLLGLIQSPEHHMQVSRLPAMHLCRWFRDPSLLGRRLTELLAAMPSAWVSAARALAQAPLSANGSSTQAFWAQVLPRLGWRLGATSPMALMSFTVKGGTHLLCMGPHGLEAQRARPLAAFAELAGPSIDVGMVQLAFRRLWRTPLPGVVKETLWRLAYDGLPTGARMHIAQLGTASGCPCGADSADRAHHFWDCVVAQGVRDVITEGAAGAGRPLHAFTRAHLWLATCPEGLHQGVWDIVALCAVAAMDKGRRYMVAQAHFAEPPAPRGLELGRRAAERAQVHFWELLHEFAAGGCSPRGVSPHKPLGTSHPFLRETSIGSMELRVTAPGGSPPGHHIGA
jgi:hypothetical protein